MSRYSKLLAKIIAESGLTLKEIVSRCNELGDGIDTTRLSKLQSGKLSAPSERVSRDIAKACNVDERKLVIEGYIEKAPKEIIDTFMTLKTYTMLVTIKTVENVITKEQIEIIKEQMEKEPLSDCIIEILDSKKDTINITSEGFDIKSKNSSFQIKEPISIEIKDNAMFPLIPENSKINLKIESKYNSGDIIAVKPKKEEDIIARYVLFYNDTIILTPLNKKYKTLVYEKKDINILGRVSKVITTI